MIRVSQTMAQVGEEGGQRWGVGIVFIDSLSGPGEEAVYECEGVGPGFSEIGRSGDRLQGWQRAAKDCFGWC